MNIRPTVCLIAAYLATVAVVGAGGQTDPASWPVRELPNRGYDALHYRIELHLDPDHKIVKGKTTVTLSPLENGLTRCVLDADTFTVTSVEDPATSSPLRYTHEDGSLAVELVRPYNKGERLSLTVSYAAEDPRVDPARSGMSEDYLLGLSFRDLSPDNPGIVSTLSFPTGARHWFPCFDHPSDRATQEVIVTVPSGWRALSNGTLVAVTEDPDAGASRFHWSLDISHPTYLSMVAAGPYETVEEPVGDLPMAYWIWPGDLEVAERAFSETPDIIRFFSRLYEFPFPWPKYDQIAVPGISGGAESTSATLIGEARIRDAIVAGGDFPMGWLVAHEAAHQWWGNVVSYRDWGETWLSESFATYSEHLYAAHAMGSDVAQIDLLKKRDAYLKEAHTRYQRPIVMSGWLDPDDNFDRHTYEKGALVLHMLRDLLGDEVFFACLARFLDDHAFQPVVTDDFLETVREVSGADLDWFFEQWLYRPGHPVFEVDTRWDPGEDTLTLYVAQTQNTANGTPIFRVPVNIGITTDEGTTTQRVWLDEPEKVLHFPCDAEPLLVRFDQGNHLLMELVHRKNPHELIYQLEHDDVTGRMWAADQLIAHTDDANTEYALARAAAWDPFWGVRREAVRALGALDPDTHLTVLRLAAGDTSSEVRAAAVEAVGLTEDTDLLPYLIERYRQDPSFRVRAAAVRAVGRCGDSSSLPFVREAEALDSPRDIVRQAASEAIDSLSPAGTDH